MKLGSNLYCKACGTYSVPPDTVEHVLVMDPSGFTARCPKCGKYQAKTVFITIWGWIGRKLGLIDDSKYKSKIIEGDYL